MRKRVVGIGVLAVSSCLLTFMSVGSTSALANRSAAIISPDSPIEHVVIIYQENHTFDDVLGGLCQIRANPCNGYTGPVTFADGITAENIVQPDIVPGISHDPIDQRHGMQGKWDLIPGCIEPPYRCVSHVDPANMQNLTELANTYTVSDATYAAGDATSFGAHVTLAGGTLDGFKGTNPVDSTTGEPPHYGWGCASNKDALWGKRLQRSYEPSCIPDRQGRGPYRASKVPYTATVMERMEEKGLSWHIYEGDAVKAPKLGIWSVCTYFAWCWLHRWDLDHDSSRADFIEAAGAGALPNLSILIPTSVGVSQHNLSSMTVGDNYIGQMVSAVMNGPDWESTAIFITYDDCGCFYDHVQPPNRHIGIRNPMVIVSPWAKPQGTDSRQASQPYSMLTFTQHLFGLRHLSPDVTKAYDYADSFDFTQKPLAGVPMTRKPISRAERRTLAVLKPSIEEDPT